MAVYLIGEHRYLLESDLTLVKVGKSKSAPEGQMDLFAGSQEWDESKHPRGEGGKFGPGGGAAAAKESPKGSESNSEHKQVSPTNLLATAFVGRFKSNHGMPSNPDAGAEGTAKEIQKLKDDPSSHHKGYANAADQIKRLEQTKQYHEQKKTGQPAYDELHQKTQNAEALKSHIFQSFAYGKNELGELSNSDGDYSALGNVLTKDSLKDVDWDAVHGAISDILQDKPIASSAMNRATQIVAESFRPSEHLKQSDDKDDQKQHEKEKKLLRSVLDNKTAAKVAVNRIFNSNAVNHYNQEAHHKLLRTQLDKVDWGQISEHINSKLLSKNKQLSNAA